MDVAAVLLLVAAVGMDDGWAPASEKDWPIRQTVHFQSGTDDGWGGNRYPSSDPNAVGNSRRYDERGATIGVDPIRTAQAPPPLFDRADQAAADNATSAARDFGQQLQNMTGFGGQSSAPPSSTTSTPRSKQSTWPAPPPLATSPTTTSAATPSAPAAPLGRPAPTVAWSAIRPEFAPPRLPTPPRANTNRLAGNSPTGRNSGPDFPSLTDNRATNTPRQPIDRSDEPNWSTGWGAASASESSSGDNNDSVGLVPVPPRVQTNSTQPLVANNPPAAAPAPAASDAADIWANFGTQQNASRPDPEADRYGTQPQAPLAAAAPSLPADQPGIDNQNQASIGTVPPANQVAPPAAPGEEVPWKPLLAVSLALAGSLGANLFLGWSYADARHRYLALVEKTTHSFQKAAGLAA